MPGFAHTFVVAPLAGAGYAVVFAGRALREMFRPPFEIKETARQLYEIGWRSLPLIAVAGFAVGIVLSMHTRASLERFGAEALIPAALMLALVRETGPLVVGLLVSGRVGAGIGAELGAMKVTEQIDALEAVAVDSFKFLVVTRVVACMLAMPILTSEPLAKRVIGRVFPAGGGGARDGQRAGCSVRRMAVTAPGKPATRGFMEPACRLLTGSLVA